MIDNEIQPWIVLIEDESGALAPAIWQLSENERPALALFLTQEAAQRYADKNGDSSWSVKHPTQKSLIGVMLACFQKEVQLAVLNPDGNNAQLIFNLRDILSAARDQVRRGEPLNNS